MLPVPCRLFNKRSSFCQLRNPCTALSISITLGSQSGICTPLYPRLAHQRVMSLRLLKGDWSRRNWARKTAGPLIWDISLILASLLEVTSDDRLGTWVRF